MILNNLTTTFRKAATQAFRTPARRPAAMKIESLNFNWFYTSDGESFRSLHVGYKMGNKTCVHIEEHLPQGDGDRLYYDVIYDDHSKERVFNPNQVFYKHE